MLANREFVVPAGMSSSVFHDKYARKKEKIDNVQLFQTWKERITEVVTGNCMLRPACLKEQYEPLLDLAVAGVIPFSGRHVQHGDKDQVLKQGEVFTNCASAMFSWMSFLLLMKGCGVGRDFSADMCFVDWDYLPNCRFVLDGPDVDGTPGHPDYEDWIESLRDARHKYQSESESVRWFEVEDSAEGWAKVVMIMETAAFHKNNKDTIFVFDLSKVRCKGTPVMGQQGRPASGPVPFIKALHKIMTVKGAGMKPWKQAMHVDHYAASCVALGGMRRSARIALKSCYDQDIIDFIDIKRGGFLQSANNTVIVDNNFWMKALNPRPSHERRVFEAAAGSSFWDDTGEPGFFNADRVNCADQRLDNINCATYLSGSFVKRMGGIHPRTYDMIDYHLQRALKKKYKFILNPCGEIPLAVWGAYCIVGDICLANARTKEEAITAAGLLGRALVRVNSMDFIYNAEVKRTNRIGVSLTGIHEFAWRLFNLTFTQLIEIEHEAAKNQFWPCIEAMREAVEDHAMSEALALGMVTPVTNTTIKPAGTIAKVMFCTEGAHLPGSRHYLRWVQFKKDDPAWEAMDRRGYPVKDVSHFYQNVVVVGFPTCLPIVEEMPADKLVTAVEASPEEQYQWLRLLEQYWLGGGFNNNQISYTLKWRKDKVDYVSYFDMLLKNQPTVRCCSLLPEMEQDASAYPYLPEEPISADRYHVLVASIDRVELEGYDKETLMCEGGACPIEEDIN